MPPTDDAADELRDAAGNLRRLANGEDLAAVYPLFVPHNLDVALCFDRGTVAHAWLAANPIDDGEAIDAGLLESLGLTERPEHLDVRSFGSNVGDWNLLCRSRRGGGWRLFAWQHMASDTQEQSVSVIAHTRGQLRRLLAALGVVPAVEGGGS